MRPLLLFLAVPLFAQPYRVIIHTGVPAKMRDGVTLRADVFRPDDPGKFPVILERTPYNRAGDTGTASELAAHGYVVIIQDVRGRFASEGDFYPFRNESADGFDTVEWAAALPNSNGHVGMSELTSAPPKCSLRSRSLRTSMRYSPT